MLEKQVETIDDIEKNSTEALELLAKRYVHIAVLLLPCNVYYVALIPVSGLFLPPRALQDQRPFRYERG